MKRPREARKVLAKLRDSCLRSLYPNAICSVVPWASSSVLRGLHFDDPSFEDDGSGTDKCDAYRLYKIHGPIYVLTHYSGFAAVYDENFVAAGTLDDVMKELPESFTGHEDTIKQAVLGLSDRVGEECVPGYDFVVCDKNEARDLSTLTCLQFDDPRHMDEAYRIYPMPGITMAVKKRFFGGYEGALVLTKHCRGSAASATGAGVQEYLTAAGTLNDVLSALPESFRGKEDRIRRKVLAPADPVFPAEVCEVSVI